MPVSEVFLWFAEDLIANGVEFSSPYITDVLRKGAKPRLRSLVIAVGEPVDFDLQETDELSIVGLARAAAFSGISQGKVRVRFEPWMDIVPIPITRALAAAGAKAGVRSQIPEIPRPLRALPLPRCRFDSPLWAE